MNAVPQHIDYFFCNLDSHLRAGVPPDEALRLTVTDYAEVCHGVSPHEPAPSQPAEPHIGNGWTYCPRCGEEVGCTFSARHDGIDVETDPAHLCRPLRVPRHGIPLGLAQRMQRDEQKQWRVDGVVSYEHVCSRCGRTIRRQCTKTFPHWLPHYALCSMCQNVNQD